MKLLLLSLFTALSLSLAAQQNADLLVYEPFDYAVFNPIWCLETGGSGWTGPWLRAIGDDAIIRAENLDYPGLTVDEGNYCAVEFVRAGIRYNRAIEPILDEGQTLWVSVLMDWRPGGNPNAVGNITLLKDGDQAFTFGRKFGNQLIGVVYAPNVTGYNTTVAAQGLHWVVLKIQFSGDSGDEQAWLWIDPDPTTEPQPATADLAIPQTGMPDLQINGGFDGVQLKNEGTPPLLMGYDEFRMGNTFQAINPLISALNNPAITGLMDFRVFPNPTIGSVRVTFTQPAVGPVTLRLLDAVGRTVQTRRLPSLPAGRQELRLDLPSHLAAGTYFLQVRSGTLGGVQTVVVK